MKLPTLAALLAASAVTLAACGGAASGTTTTSGGGSPSPTASSGAGIHAATTSLGKVLVDANGRTVYLLTADGRDMSTCADDCLKFWPAVAPGRAKLGVPVGSTTTPGGTRVATVAGQPVYTFANDQAPGDVNGEGLQEFGGTWYAVSPSGQAVTGAAASGSSSPSSGGRYSY